VNVLIHEIKLRRGEGGSSRVNVTQSGELVVFSGFIRFLEFS